MATDAPGAPDPRPGDRTPDVLDELLGLVGVEAGSSHVVEDPCPAEFTWEYTKGARPRLDRLYEKAKVSQWNATTDLPWETVVDPEAVAAANAAADAAFLWTPEDCAGTALAAWGPAEWLRFGMEHQNWMLSQFLHGEQGALLCTAKIVQTVPWIDAKYYAATQVLDEARHVEVFSRYLDEKLAGHYPLNAHLGLLLDDILADSRWDLTYLGMQIMVEGLALASFGLMAQMTQEPLLAQLLGAVMADEARHVAFGILSLEEYYRELSTAELRDRQEFAFDAALRMRDRMALQEIWARLGVSHEDARTMVSRSAQRHRFAGLLFSKIVPALSRLGLLDAGDGWLRARFTELGVIGFEDAGAWLDQDLGAPSPA
jgi:hypothetical protein